MRIDTVTAHAFGPLVEQTLALTPGLTVIVGGNESAKSSWHAATYAAVCGRRRGQGQPGPRDKQFIARHRPWDGGAWTVSARLTLDDGRVIEMSQDLDGRVNCRAMEIPLGRDVSNTVMFDGSVDASIFLGLNRRAFEATACIRQTDVLSVRGSGDALAELLSSAAATGGADESTARALARIENFRREAVGTDRVNAVRPWRLALDTVATADAAAKGARDSRAEFDRRAIEVEALERDAAALRAEVVLVRAARARDVATAVGARASKATELAAALGSERPANAAAAHESLGLVTAAVTSWASQPAVPAAGDDPSAIEALIAALPAAPTHDTAPAQSVASAHGSYTAAAASLMRHDEQAAAVPVNAPDGPSATDIRDLATRYDALGPEPPAPEAPTAPAPVARPWWPWVIAAVGAVGALGAIVAGQTAVAAIAAVVAVVGVVLGLRRPSAASAPVAAPDPRPEWRARRAALDQRGADIGAPADAAALASAAQQAQLAEAAYSAHERWQQDRVTLEGAVTLAQAELRGALSGRVDLVALDDLDAAYSSYVAACTNAHQVAEQAVRRPLLEARLTEARAAAERRSSAQAAMERASGSLHAAAAALGDALSDDVDPQDDAALAVALQGWLDQQKHAAGELAGLEEKWAALDRLLGTADLDTLTREAAEAQAAALTAAEGLDPATLAAVAAPDDSAVADLEARARAAEQEAANQAGALQEFASALPDVSTLEEAHDAAQDELARVLALKEILERTTGFMTEAQDRVHRDIAPALQASLVRWLPVVTQDRYVDATVDPQTLDVQVCGTGGKWRRAELLSYGTAEQIYLLLRLALVEHLTAGHDTCPLLLDDVTVHADSTRTIEVLELLRAVAEHRQVILFTQEDQVADWARVALDSSPGSVVDLVEIPAP